MSQVIASRRVRFQALQLDGLAALLTQSVGTGFDASQRILHVAQFVRVASALRAGTIDDQIRNRSVTVVWRFARNPAEIFRRGALLARAELTHQFLLTLPQARGELIES